MSKITKLASTALLMAALMLLLSGLTPVAYAASSDDVRQTDDIVEVDFSEDAQQLKLVKGKNYLISCPVSGEGWQISEIRFCLKDGTWLLFDEDTENEYISVEKWEEVEPGKAQMLIQCKSADLVGLKVGLENEITGEKKGYSFALTVSVPQPVSDSHFVILQPTVPSDEDTNAPTTPPDDGTDNPDTPPDEGTDVPVTPPDGGDEGDDNEEENPVPPPIVIDTTGWSFDSLTTVYDGKEYTVEVTGLPDYVTPVYTGNTRTNAGTNTAHVSFLVPEGYATPEDMETTITIEKAPLCIINDKNLVETADGKLKFLIPDGALPDGVSYTYTVNDIVADDDYVINNTGMYIVNTEFELTEDFPEEMKQNYITDSSSVIYNVLEHEDITPSEYGLNFVLKLEQAESQAPDEVRVTVSIKFDSSSGRNSVLTYVPVYDSSALTYVGSDLPEGMGAGKINAQGVVAAYTDSFGLLNDGPLTTFIFKVNEGADVTNLPFSVTEVSGVWIAPDPSVIDQSTSYSTAIVLNPSVDTEQYTVMLPAPAGTQAIAQTDAEISSGQEETSAEGLSSEDQSDAVLPDEQTCNESLLDGGSIPTAIEE